MASVKPEKAPSKAFWWFKLLLGPLVFILFELLPIAGLDAKAKFAVALYLWMVVWWITQSIPWAITGLLPLAILPMGSIMKFNEVTVTYGQRLLFFLMGVLLFGYAVQKHGLGKRIAIYVLNIRWVGASTNRILIAFLSAVAVMSAFVDDAATIAMCMPIGMAIIEYAVSVWEKIEGKKVQATKLKAFMALGILYASEAGGIMTVGGIPHIPTAISLLEKTAKMSISYTQWSAVGIFLGVASLLVYFTVLNFFFKPEFKQIEGAREFFAQEKASLGKPSRGEINTLIAFIVMLVLWLLPAFPFGKQIKFLDIWIVPAIGVILLYLLPVDWKKGEGTLVARDLQAGIPWNVVLLAVSATAMSDIAVKFGAVDWFKSLIPTAINGALLPFFAGFVMPTISNFISGVAATNLLGNIFFPIATEVGYNPAVLARILPATGMAVALPWAGAATATAFSTGHIKIQDMIKVGIVVTILHALTVIILSMLLVPLFGAYTVL